MIKIEITQRNIQDSETFYIIECNVYDENNVFKQQLSRSPFVFPNEMTDEEIIESVQINEYNIYF